MHGQVCFELSDLGNSVEFAFCHGVLSNGREYAMALPSASAAVDGGVAYKVIRPPFRIKLFCNEMTRFFVLDSVDRHSRSGG
jgi:phenylalanine-4-hydroxylase